MHVRLQNLQSIPDDSNDEECYGLHPAPKKIPLFVNILPMTNFYNEDMKFFFIDVHDHSIVSNS